MKEFIKKIPIVGRLAVQIYHWLVPAKPFSSSMDYWMQRYAAGGNSGPGSYHKLAEFKAEILNSFVKEKDVKTVIEFGCGDGNQLRLARYPSYIGFDISPEAISRCRKTFSNDKSKVFRFMEQHQGEMAELALSLDVIYHLVEDDVFNDYMNKLFNSSTKFVIIYSSNTSFNPDDQQQYIKHRNFSIWVEEHRPDWKLIDLIPNRYPLVNNNWKEGSFADFYIYEKR